MPSKKKKSWSAWIDQEQPKKTTYQTNQSQC